MQGGALGYFNTSVTLAATNGTGGVGKMALRTIHRWCFREYLLIYALIKASATRDYGHSDKRVHGVTSPL
jgi:hypothetical protein